MVRLNQEIIQVALRHFERRKLFTIAQLSSFLNCSVANARLKVKQWSCYTSYNQNGKYYTLPGVAQFNQYGLWRYQDVAFSKHGNLKQTIIHLVASSAGGLSGRQLGQILGLSPQSFLHHFRNCPGICREKHDGVFVYFSEVEPIYKNQLQQRHSLVRRPEIVTITDAQAVMILVALIKEHGITAQQIMDLSQIRASRLKLSNVQGFMQYHGLLKKTPDSRH